MILLQLLLAIPFLALGYALEPRKASGVFRRSALWVCGVLSATTLINLLIAWITEESLGSIAVAAYSNSMLGILVTPIILLAAIIAWVVHWLRMKSTGPL